MEQKRKSSGFFPCCRYDGAAESQDMMELMNDFADKYKSALVPDDGSNPEAEVFAMSPAYGDYVLMGVIVKELYRNVLLAMGCVFVAALFLIANLTASAIVVGCVFMSIIDVGGFMYLW